ncbi:CHAD domain-containing protein [Saccharomonospora amisosensis]|uniref:CHAD domain-containing protein n=1 Tax=Saccharomonospora amisosensis TaxID=1128677 RepID=A0A7X5ZPR4_9PSEU|nr:CHAD domain-containing protein [Saccharomonospora amisosensis]NIJ10992.1 CHAD domain-containing protein [Saccharomonospora amisosensis]
MRTVTYLDTVDHRLRRKNLVLTHQRAGAAGELVLAGNGDTYTVHLKEPPRWPARLEQLPHGVVRDELGPVIGIRAVLPTLTARTVTREVAVRDGQGDLVARFDWAETTATEPAATEPLVRITLYPQPGSRKAGERLAKGLRAAPEIQPAPATQAEAYTELLTATGALREAGNGRPPITRDMPADAAVATALLGFADTIADTLDGVVDDVDAEFLHDLRVAVRRTRSLLKLAGDVLPAEPVRRYAAEFAWLGDLTTPTRDLDVFLLRMDDLAGTLLACEGADLRPFVEHLRAERDRAHGELVGGLLSQRFSSLLDGWRRELDAVLEKSDTARETSVGSARQLAEKRLRRAVKRVVRMAATITPDSPGARVHDLRKRCKELRYLLEVARPVCDARAHRAALRDLKRLQDVLGDFQDGEVQSAALHTFAEQLQASDPRPPAATLLAMGELAAGLVAQQRQARADLTGVLREFLGPATQKHLRAL